MQPSLQCNYRKFSSPQKETPATIALGILCSLQQCMNIPVSAYPHQQSTCYYLILDCSCPSGCEVLCPCGFGVHFPWWQMILSIFSCPCWPFVNHHWRNVHSDSNPVFILLLSCENSLYILGTSPLLGTWFENTFYHAVGCLFTFLKVSFAQKFSFCWSPIYLFFPLVAYAFVLYLRNDFQIQGHEYLHRFTSKSFILCLTLRSLIYFEFIFCIWCKIGDQLHSLHVTIQFPQHCILKRLLLLKALLKIDCKCEDSFLNIQFCSTDLHVCPYASTTLSWLL